MVTTVEFYMEIGIFNVNHCRVIYDIGILWILIYEYRYIMDSI